MLNVAPLLLTPYRLGALRLLEAADLAVLPTLTGWAITDPEQPAATALIASGDTLAAAIDAALPVALADGYVLAEDVELLDGPAEPGHCGWCAGTGTGVSDRHVCRGCGGSGVEQVAS
jgi:hypothetical protein